MFAPPYNRPVAAATEMAMGVTHRQEGRDLTPTVDGHVLVADAVRGGATVFVIPAHYLTLNVALFAAVVAAAPRRPALRHLMAALAVLYLGHVAGLYATIEAQYAGDLGQWSARRYGPLSRDFWRAVAQFYRLIGMYALAFVVGWLATGPETAAAGKSRRRRTR